MDDATTARGLCPACGEGRPLRLTAVRDHEYGLDLTVSYGECDRCGTCYQVPMPGEAQLAACYPPGYHSFAATGAITRARHDLRLRRLRPLLAGGGALLDFGCGSGSFLAHAAERLPGVPLFGYEIGARDVETAAGGRITIVRGSLDDLFARLPKCRVITMNHVIEHLPEPHATVSALASHLAEGGALEGQTPAADALERTLFRRRWSGYHAPRHTVVFSRDGLRRLLARAGFRRVTVAAAFNPASWAVSLGSALHGPGPARLERRGARWLGLLALATLAAPLDVVSRRPAVVDFVGARA